MTTLIGTNPDQIPINSMLGGMAYQDPDSISVKDFNSSGTANIASLVSPAASVTTLTNTTANITNLSYTGTLTGGTGVINIGSSQIYKDASGNVSLGGTGALKLNEGTTAQRPASPAAGMIRYNTSMQYAEVYNGAIWSGVVTSDRGVFFQPVYLGTNGSSGQLRFHRAGDGTLRATMTAETSNTVLDCNTELLLKIGSSTIADITSTGVAVTGVVTSTADAVGSNDLTRLGLFLRSHSANGYQKLPGGLYVQWGTVYVGDHTIYTGSVSFPITFPNGVFNVVTSVYDTTALSGVGATTLVAVTSQNSSGFNYGLREFTGSVQNASVTYIAIGY